MALSPGPTHPGFNRFIPKRTGTPYSQPLFIAFLPSRSQMSKPIQNPRPIFFGNKGPKNLTPFSTHLKPPSPGISISRSAEPYYIECRVITQCFITKSSLPWKDSIFFSPKSQDLGCSFSGAATRNLDCLQARHVLCLQARHLLCLQPRHLLCQQTRDLQSAKTSPGH